MNLAGIMFSLLSVPNSGTEIIEMPPQNEIDDADTTSDGNPCRGRPNFGFGLGFGVECGQMGTFGGHSVSAESSRTTFGALSVSACCCW